MLRATLHRAIQNTDEARTKRDKWLVESMAQAVHAGISRAFK